MNYRHNRIGRNRQGLNRRQAADASLYDLGDDQTDAFLWMADDEDAEFAGWLRGGVMEEGMGWWGRRLLTPAQ